MLIRSKILRTKSPAWRLTPDFIAPVITDIDFGFLRDLGIKACLVDLDGTSVHRDTYDVDPPIAAALKRSTLDIYIATNRPISRDLRTLKNDLHASGVIHPKGLRGKPTKQYYQQALHTLGLEPTQVVMVGDRYIQDILGANRAGIYSLLVYKLGESKGMFDKLFSSLESAATQATLGRYHRIERVK
jgi:HAD superfamily phosphatase (TIGR01668 family)